MFPALAQLCPESLLYNNHHLSGSQAAGESGEARMPGSAPHPGPRKVSPPRQAQWGHSPAIRRWGVQMLVRGAGQSGCCVKPHPQNSDRQCPEPMIEVTVGFAVNPFLGPCFGVLSPHNFPRTAPTYTG